MRSRRILSLLVAAAMSTGMDCGPDTVATLTAIELSPQTIVGGAPVNGTARISQAAPTGGLVVTLSSNNTAVATVPASVTVPSGATSAPFTVTTNQVANNTPVVITGVGGTTATSNLTIAPPALTAIFTVTRANGTVANECRLQSGGNQFDCVFNASTSIGPITKYEWFFTISPNNPGQNERTAAQNAQTVELNPVLTGGCGFFNGRTGGGAATPLNMHVRLTVTAQAGATATTTNTNVSMIPLALTCGF